MPVPGVNPYVAPAVICPNCGDKLEPQFQKTKGAKIPEVQYVCVNKKSNCAYRVVLSLEHVRGECSPLKKDEAEKIREEEQAVADVANHRDESLRELIRLLPVLRVIAQAVGQEEKSDLTTEPDPSVAGG